MLGAIQRIIKSRMLDEATSKSKKLTEQKKSPNADILPVSGAGQLGTAKLMNTYKKDTPEQNITGFKSYKRTK